MKPGQESLTAVMVCAARAAAHGRTGVGAFADPTALALLPEGARENVERFRSGAAPTSLRERVGHTMLAKLPLDGITGRGEPGGDVYRRVPAVAG